MTIFSIVLLCLGLVLLGAWLWTRVIAARAIGTVPPAGRFLAVTGGVIHYLDEGPRDAVPLVMIHGLAGNLRHFTHSLTELLITDYRVICLDRPGAGHSTRDNDEDAQLPAQAHMLQECLDLLGIERPVLVGHSLGGALALTMALDNPGKVAGLALISPLTRRMADPPVVFKPLLVRSKWLRRLIGHTVAVPIAALTIKQALADVSAPEPPPEDMMIRGGGNTGMRPKGYITASADLVGATDSIGRLAERYDDELKTPGGVLFGAEDPILSPQVHGRSMQTHGLVYEELPGRGHMIPVTAPQDCARFIRKIADHGIG